MRPWTSWSGSRPVVVNACADAPEAGPSRAPPARRGGRRAGGVRRDSRRRRRSGVGAAPTSTAASPRSDGHARRSPTRPSPSCAPAAARSGDGASRVNSTDRCTRPRTRVRGRPRGRDGARRSGRRLAVVVGATARPPADGGRARRWPAPAGGARAPRPAFGAGCRTAFAAAAGLALAVLLSRVVDAQNAFWIGLGALSVLRSNALSTGATVLRALLGTVVGFAIGGAAGRDHRHGSRRAVDAASRS